MSSRKFPGPAAAGAVLLLCSQLLLAACAVTDPVRHESYQKPIAHPARILLMKPDIECSALTASGLVEPNAAWTAQCQRSVHAALTQYMEENEAELIVYDDAELPPDRVSRYRELSRLYEVVGVSMLLRASLPTAKSKTDWTMGEGVRIMREDHDADYALFIFLRDEYETGGRIATRVAGALFGYAPRSAVQQGFAALVDLETGDIVWFNRLFSVTGDLREPAPARDAVELLLAGSPIL